MTYLLDGNAIAGDLFGAFGREMTDVVGKCRNCGKASAVAELCVYARAPGAVAAVPAVMPYGCIRTRDLTSVKRLTPGRA